MRARALGFVVLVSSLATSAFAADRTIQNGIDVWQTPGDGSTFVDFSKSPIPAGFFCPGSAPFTAKVAFQGAPLVTSVPGALGAADTIVQRLDDATFNRKGVATTRIQFRALSLKAVKPVETSCGAYNATVSLDGTQPTTRMRIVRDSKDGGRFLAPLALNVRISFTPVGRVSAEALEISREVRFPAIPVPWQDKVVKPGPAGFVLVDTDGDRVADTYLPGTSNFIAGQSREAAAKYGGGYYYCHYSGDEHQHCIWLCDGCAIP